MFTIIGYNNGDFWTAGNWLKVIILYYFWKMTSFVYDYQRYFQEITYVKVHYVHKKKTRLNFAYVA